MEAAIGVLLTLVVITAQTTQQLATKPSDKCAIEGVVVKAATAEPLKKATVMLRKSEGRDPGKYASTDASGRFEIKDLDPGRYYLHVHRNGYVDVEYGQSTPNGPGTILALAPSQRVRDVTFHLIPAAAIAGHVYDEDGEPVAEAEVQALRYEYEKGQRTLVPAGFAQTNDLGEYRLFGLPPGQYYVGASYSPGRVGLPGSEGGYTSTYYPGTTDPSRATPLALRAGEDFPGVEISLQPTRGVTIRGRVFNTLREQSVVRANVYILPRGAGATLLTIENQAYVENPQGAFELRGVSPGSYIIVASTHEDGKRYTAREPLEVGSTDIEGITLVIGPGTELKGRVRVERKPDWSWSELDVVLSPRDDVPTGWSRASVKPDGTFVLTNVADGAYRIRLGTLPEDFYLKAARLEGEEVLESGLTLSRKQPSGSLELVVSPSGGRLDGVVLKEQRPFNAATVVLVPEPAKRGQEQLYKVTTTDQYGRFRLRGVAPGEYKLFGWETVEQGAWWNPDFLRANEDRGQSVHVEEGSRQDVQLALIPASDSPQ